MVVFAVLVGVMVVVVTVVVAVVLVVVVKGLEGVRIGHEVLRPHCSPLTTTLDGLGVVLLLSVLIMRAKLAVH